MADIEEIKRAVRIEDIIEADGYSLTSSGRYRRAQSHDSLVVDTVKQGYHWNSQSEHGDVINWVMTRHGYDFKRAIEELCKRANLPMPTWSGEDMEQRIAARTREDVYQVAAAIMQQWLLNDERAMAYARGRGWTDETIQDAMLGYTGIGTQRLERRQELRNALVLAGHKEDEPVVVALLGYNGDVAAWAKRHGKNLPVKWIEQGYIPGLVGRDALVYPHVHNGRVIYFSSRYLEDLPDRGKSYNLPADLVGERQLYLNHAWRSNADSCVVVEGQADAITLGQWGIASLALVGVAANDRLGQMLAKHKKVFVALDGDQAGRNNLGKVCEAVHPLARVLRWPDMNSEVKDANDLRQYWLSNGMEDADQVAHVQGRMVDALSYLELVAAACGSTPDQSDRDARELEVLKLYIRLDETQQAQYRDRVATALGRKLRDFDRLVKQITGQRVDDDNRPDKIVPVWGGHHDGYLIEYLYDPQDHTAALAYREVQREDGTPGPVCKAKWLDVHANGSFVRYVPEEPYDFVFNESVLFPSDLGEPKSDRELVAIVEQFLRTYYLFDDDTLPRIIAYYVLMTWLYDAFNAVSYLRALGGAGSGKSELMRRIGYVCYRGIKSSGADTPATMFRTVEQFGGTMVIDEYDQEGGGETTNDFVKVLNMGAMRDGAVNRMMEYVDANGDKRMRPGSFSTYCPKLLNGRQDMKDDAIASRCLTFYLMPNTQMELIKANVPLFIDSTFRRRAMAIRNLLVRWRLERWQPEIEVRQEDIDPLISPRMNQVTAPMKAIARIGGDEGVKQDLTLLLREMHAQEVLGRAETLAARVVEALWRIFLYPELHVRFFERAETGALAVLPGSVAEETNKLIDRMNAAGGREDEEEEKQRDGARVHSRKIGFIMRTDLQLRPLSRTRSGIPYAWNETKMVAHAIRYGVDWERVLAHILAKRKREHIPEEVLALAEKMEIAAAIDPMAEDEPEAKTEKTAETVVEKAGPEQEELL